MADLGASGEVYDVDEVVMEPHNVTTDATPDEAVALAEKEIVLSEEVMEPPEIGVEQGEVVEEEVLDVPEEGGFDLAKDDPVVEPVAEAVIELEPSPERQIEVVPLPPDVGDIKEPAAVLLARARLPGVSQLDGLPTALPGGREGSTGPCAGEPGSVAPRGGPSAPPPVDTASEVPSAKAVTNDTAAATAAAAKAAPKPEEVAEAAPKGAQAGPAAVTASVGNAGSTAATGAAAPEAASAVLMAATHHLAPAPALADDTPAGATGKAGDGTLLSISHGNTGPDSRAPEMGQKGCQPAGDSAVAIGGSLGVNPGGKLGGLGGGNGPAPLPLVEEGGSAPPPGKDGGPAMEQPEPRPDTGGGAGGVLALPSGRGEAASTWGPALEGVEAPAPKGLEAPGPEALEAPSPASEPAPEVMEAPAHKVVEAPVSELAPEVVEAPAIASAPTAEGGGAPSGAVARGRGRPRKGKEPHVPASESAWETKRSRAQFQKAGAAAESTARRSTRGTAGAAHMALDGAEVAGRASEAASVQGAGARGQVAEASDRTGRVVVAGEAPKKDDASGEKEGAAGEAGVKEVGAQTAPPGSQEAGGSAVEAAAPLQQVEITVQEVTVQAKVKKAAAEAQKAEPSQKAATQGPEKVPSSKEAETDGSLNVALQQGMQDAAGEGASEGPPPEGSPAKRGRAAKTGKTGRGRAALKTAGADEQLVGARVQQPAIVGERGANAGEQAARAGERAARAGQRAGGVAARPGRAPDGSDAKTATPRKGGVGTPGGGRKGSGSKGAGEVRAAVVPGEIVWVRYKGNAWWPARVLHEAKVEEELRKGKRKGCLPVAFHGDRTFLWVDEDNVVPFAPNLPILWDATLAGKASVRLAQAVQEAIEDVEDDVFEALPNKAAVEERKLENGGVYKGRADFRPQVALRYVKELAIAPAGRRPPAVEPAELRGQLLALRAWLYENQDVVGPGEAELDWETGDKVRHKRKSGKRGREGEVAGEDGEGGDESREGDAGEGEKGEEKEDEVVVMELEENVAKRRGRKRKTESEGEGGAEEVKTPKKRGRKRKEGSGEGPYGEASVHGRTATNRRKGDAAAGARGPEEAATEGTTPASATGAGQKRGRPHKSSLGVGTASKLAGNGGGPTKSDAGQEALAGTGGQGALGETGRKRGRPKKSDVAQGSLGDAGTSDPSTGRKRGRPRRSDIGVGLDSEPATVGKSGQKSRRPRKSGGLEAGNVAKDTEVVKAAWGTGIIQHESDEELEVEVVNDPYTWVDDEEERATDLEGKTRSGEVGQPMGEVELFRMLKDDEVVEEEQDDKGKRGVGKDKQAGSGKVKGLRGGTDRKARGVAGKGAGSGGQLKGRNKTGKKQEQTRRQPGKARKLGEEAIPEVEGGERVIVVEDSGEMGDGSEKAAVGQGTPRVAGKNASRARVGASTASKGGEAPVTSAAEVRKGGEGRGRRAKNKPAQGAEGGDAGVGEGRGGAVSVIAVEEVVAIVGADNAMATLKRRGRPPKVAKDVAAEVQEERHDDGNGSGRVHQVEADENAGAGEGDGKGGARKIRQVHPRNRVRGVEDGKEDVTEPARGPAARDSRARTREQRGGASGDGVGGEGRREGLPDNGGHGSAVASGGRGRGSKAVGAVASGATTKPASTAATKLARGGANEKQGSEGIDVDQKVEGDGKVAVHAPEKRKGAQTRVGKASGDVMRAMRASTIRSRGTEDRFPDPSEEKGNDAKEGLGQANQTGKKGASASQEPRVTRSNKRGP